jgi:exonuclease VII small subunit
MDELQNSLARMDTSRKQARDIEAPGYFPGEWDAAEDRYTDARVTSADVTLGDVKKTIALYETVVEIYDNLARQCVPLFYEDLAEEILQARDEAIDAGIRALSPNRLEAADQRIDRALDQYEAGNAATENSDAADNYYAAAASAFDALNCYHALSLGTKARRLEGEIQARGFEDYDPSNYGRGKEALDTAVAAYDEGETTTALARADEALLHYTIAMDRGWLGYAGDMRLSAEAERRNALQYKANVAVKRDFDQADGLYTRGIDAYNAQDYATSVDYFSQAIPLFSNAIKITEQKRVIAEEAIHTAETRISQSEQTAREAETLLQGGAQ